LTLVLLINITARLALSRGPYVPRG